MYTEKDAVEKFLAGDYGSVSALTIGSEERARRHEETGARDLAAIHRLSIDDARFFLIYMLGRHPLVFRQCWTEILNRELPKA